MKKPLTDDIIIYKELRKKSINEIGIIMKFTIGNKIRLLRLSRGLTQEQLAEKLCVAPQSVSKWENDITAPDIQLLPQISVMFGVTIDELFSITDESRLERIENLLEAADRSTIIPEDDFERYRSFLNENKDNPKLKGRVLTAIAGMYIQQSDGYRAAAAKYALEAIASEPDEKINHSLLRSAWNGADRDWCNGNHHELISFYMEFIENHPENVPALQLLLDNLIADSRLSEAGFVLAELRAADSSCRSMWYEAQIAYRKADTATAEKCLRDMTDKFPSDWLAWAYRGDYYACLSKYDEAVCSYEKSIELQPAPRYIDSFLCIAQIHIIQKRYKDAAKYYRKIIGLLETDWNITEGDAVDKYRRLAEHYSNM